MESTVVGYMQSVTAFGLMQTFFAVLRSSLVLLERVLDSMCSVQDLVALRMH